MPRTVEKTPSQSLTAAFQSALPRPLDFAYPSNRYAAGGLVAGVLLSRLRGQSWRQAVGTGLAGFAAWATARELDPDHPESATAALPLALGAALLDAAPDALAGFTTLSGVRVLAGTVGHAPTPLDSVVLMAGAVFSANAGDRVVAALPGAALGLSALEHDRFSPEPLAALVGTAALLPSRDYTPKRSVLSDVLALAALGVGGALARPEHIRSHYDVVPTKVADERILRVRQLSAGALAAGLLLRQTRSLTPLAAAVLGVGWRRLK